MATSGWFSSTFDNFKGSEASVKKCGSFPQDKRKRKVITNPKIPPGGITWVDKYRPKEKDDLVVHKGKVQQVEAWIKESQLSLKARNRKCPLLLLTGPAGAGKTATVHALASHFGLAVSEWKNTTQFVAYGSEDNVFEEKQLSSFKSFLLRASRYSSLTEERESGYLVLVEDFPNICFREPESFHSVLRQYMKIGRSPTVFILSDSSRRDISSNKLFPRDVIQELGISQISFNPITTLTISRLFQKVLASEKAVSGSQVRLISKQELDSLAEGCAGDIRTAINSLQFAATSTAQVRKVPKKAKASVTFKKVSEPEEHSVSLGKDSTLLLFHALGKVLYCKRDSSKPVIPLPKHMEKLQRYALKENPESVVDRSGTSSQNFILFLHQNYLEFFHEDDIFSEASDYLSTADCLHPSFEDLSHENEYGSSVGVRGLMFHLGGERHGIHKRNWLSFRKPGWYDTHRNHQKNLISSREEFKESLLRMGNDLYVTCIPYLDRISCASLTPGQKLLVQKLSRFSGQNTYRSRFSEDLDVEEEEDQSCTYNYLNSDVSVAVHDENEDDVNIEEFSD